jgi:3',5'-nucleoside bisphosphate phosphatase
MMDDLPRPGAAVSDRVLIDLHCHTLEKSYDGRVPVVEIVRRAHRAGLHGIVLTDHNRVWTREELDAVVAEAALGEAFVLFAGQEVRTTVREELAGDLLVYGLDTEYADNIPAEELLARVADTPGAWVIAAHAGVPRIGFGPYLVEFAVDAVEVWNGRYGGKAAALAEEFAMKARRPMTGGSDTHELEDIAGGATSVPRLPRDLADLGAMIKAGEGEAWRPDVKRRLARWLTGSGTD